MLLKDTEEQTGLTDNQINRAEYEQHRATEHQDNNRATQLPVQAKSTGYR
jgi:hypothetical protein